MLSHNNPCRGARSAFSRVRFRAPKQIVREQIPKIDPDQTLSGFKRRDTIVIKPAGQMHRGDPIAFGNLAKRDIVALKGSDAGSGDAAALEIGVGIALADLLQQARIAQASDRGQADAQISCRVSKAGVVIQALRIPVAKGVRCDAQGLKPGSLALRDLPIDDAAAPRRDDARQADAPMGAEGRQRQIAGPWPGPGKRIDSLQKRVDFRAAGIAQRRSETQMRQHLRVDQGLYLFGPDAQSLGRLCEIAERRPECSDAVQIGRRDAGPCCDLTRLDAVYMREKTLQKADAQLRPAASFVEGDLGDRVGKHA